MWHGEWTESFEIRVPSRSRYWLVRISGSYQRCSFSRLRLLVFVDYSEFVARLPLIFIVTIFGRKGIREDELRVTFIVFLFVQCVRHCGENHNQDTTDALWRQDRSLSLTSAYLESYRQFDSGKIEITEKSRYDNTLHDHNNKRSTEDLSRSYTKIKIWLVFASLVPPSISVKGL